MREYEEEYEIELIDYLNILWKRKWFILLLTLLCVIIAGIVSFLLPPVWEVDVVILPSKILIQASDGGLREFTFDDSTQIAGQINEGSYDKMIANELKLDVVDFPELNAENLKDTQLVRVSVREKDVEKALLILTSLFNHLKKQLDGKAEIEKARMQEEYKAFEKKLEVVKQRIKEIEKEIRNTWERIKVLENEQRLNLKKEKKSEEEILGMLLYSNEIILSFKYYDELSELLSEKKIEEEELYFKIEEKKEAVKRIDFTHLMKEPTSSFAPVAPQKKRIVLIAGTVGLIVSILLAFLLEYIEKQRLKGKT